MSEEHLQYILTEPHQFQLFEIIILVQSIEPTSHSSVRLDLRSEVFFQGVGVSLDPFYSPKRPGVSKKLLFSCWQGSSFVLSTHHFEALGQTKGDLAGVATINGWASLLKSSNYVQFDNNSFMGSCKTFDVYFEFNPGHYGLKKTS